MSLDLAAALRGQLVMAPMTRGTDLPFRRLLAEYDTPIVWGEMAFAHQLVKGNSVERALTRRHEDERLFGAQIAGKKPTMMAEAARMVEGSGADFVDVNLGCPIEQANRRGYGAAMLRKATLVGRVVEAMKAAVSIPVTIKLRLGWSSEKPTFLRVAKIAEEAGVDAIALHARSRTQRYRRAADWDAIRALKETVSVPVIGNGDILHWKQARERLDAGDCDAVMIGRWGLTKPWIFREFARETSWEPSAEERLTMLRRYVELCFETFKQDDWGRANTRRFLTFHQDFFARYRRGIDPSTTASDEARQPGLPPEPGLESWLSRRDLIGMETLADWLIDGKEASPPPPETTGAERAVRLPAAG